MCQYGAKLGHIGGVLNGHVSASAEEVIDGQHNVGLAFHFELHKQLQKDNQNTFFSMIDPIPDGVEANFLALCRIGDSTAGVSASASDVRNTKVKCEGRRVCCSPVRLDPTLIFRRCKF